MKVHCSLVPYVKSMLIQDCRLTLNCPSVACAAPYVGIVRRLWEGDCLAEHGHPLARPMGMPSGHVAHASLMEDAWLHYPLVMDFTTYSEQTISNR